MVDYSNTDFNIEILGSFYEKDKNFKDFDEREKKLNEICKINLFVDCY